MNVTFHRGCKIQPDPEYHYYRVFNSAGFVVGGIFSSVASAINYIDSVLI